MLEESRMPLLQSTSRTLQTRSYVGRTLYSSCSSEGHTKDASKGFATKHDASVEVPYLPIDTAF